MLKVGVDEAAANLKVLLEQVAKGEEIILIQQDRAIARLVPLQTHAPQTREQWLARTRRFRSTFQVKGEPLSATIVKTRQGERY
jgi:antitoxin (DNA-binding transcriptional repressor) of toxin-antitoxin stability system